MCYVLCDDLASHMSSGGSDMRHVLFDDLGSHMSSGGSDMRHVLSESGSNGTFFTFLKPKIKIFSAKHELKYSLRIQSVSFVNWCYKTGLIKKQVVW